MVLVNADMALVRGVELFSKQLIHSKLVIEPEFASLKERKVIYQV